MGIQHRCCYYYGVLLWVLLCLLMRRCNSTHQQQKDSTICSLSGCNCTSAAPAWTNVNCSFSITQASFWKIHHKNRFSRTTESYCLKQSIQGSNIFIISCFISLFIMRLMVAFIWWIRPDFRFADAAHARNKKE